MSEGNGKTVLITGASSGIGKATAELLTEKGYAVYGAARRLERMKDLEEKGVRLIKMDLTEENSIVEGVKTIEKERGGVDILINNAGYGLYGAVEDVPIEEARRQFEVNLFGAARLIQLVLPHMRKNRYGKIVNISSVGGKIFSPMGAWYHATKHALEGLSDCLRFEVKRFGIDVIVIEPGGVGTEWGDIAVQNLLKTSGEGAYSEVAKRVAEFMKRTYESGRLPGPESVARVIYRAITAKKPKTRYTAGYMAKPMLLARWLFPDRLFDLGIELTVRYF